MSKFDIDEALIRKLAKLLKETGLTEIEFETDDARIRVNAGASGPGIAAAPALASPAAVAAAGAAPAADAPAAGSISSPMVGTAYRSPEPGAPPFVEAGAKVTAGQTILIIEAMKTMNHIPAPKAGVVTTIFVGNGQPVEFGETLVIIE